MANHFSHAALPYPVKNARYTLLVPYLDADGDPTDPTTPDTEISKDAGSFADTTEEVSTLTGSNGMGYITLTGAETDCVMLGLAAKVASGPKATLATLYPRVLAVLFSGTATAGAAGTLTLATDIPAVADLLVGCILKTTGGTGGGGTGGANNQARVITDFTTGRVASVVPNWETTPDATTTYEVLLTEAALLRYADVRLWRGTEPNALVSSRVDASVGAMAADVITSSAIAAGAIGSSEAPNLDAAVSSRATPADVNAQVLDVVDTTTFSMPGQAAPPASPTFRQMLGYLYKAFRNRKTQTATLWSLLADDESTVDQKATVSDDGTTAIKQEIVSGP